MKATTLVVLLALVVVLAGFSAQPNTPPSDLKAVAYLRSVNTKQMSHLHQHRRYMTDQELRTALTVPEGWTVEQILSADQKSYAVTLVYGERCGTVFFTNSSGNIFKGKQIGC